MCGIVGFISKNGNGISIDTGIEALKRLEYRGYDSAGIAYLDEKANSVGCLKAVGRISNLEKKTDETDFVYSDPVILHTRWATHGEVTEENAHPHSDCHQNIWLVHNGIIENYQILKEELEKEGHIFTSGTDSEVIAHLIEKFFDGNLEDAVRASLKLLTGTYGLVVMARDDPDKLVVARFSSPLLIGLGKDQYIVASDPSAVIMHTKKVIYLDDGEIAIIGRDKFTVIREKKPENIEMVPEEYQKAGYPHFMLKEIMEQPTTVKDALNGRVSVADGTAILGGLESVRSVLKHINRIHIVACGTARHAGLIGEYMLEEYTGIITKTDAASEFRYRNPILDKNSLVIGISQSGETADTLAALREAKGKGILTLGITNVVGSSQSRETSAGVYTRSGLEVGVASTKAFTSQLVVMALLTLFLGRQRQLSLSQGQLIAKELLRLPELVQQVLQTNSQIEELAHKYKDFENFLYLGRKYSYPIAREGAHKIKETAYIHAEGVRGGEPKHCEIALISDMFPSMCLAPSDSVYDKMVSNIEELKARKGPIIAVANENNKSISSIADDVIYIPETIEMLTPVLTVIPLQLFAYHTAVLRGCDVDKPKNLAKSVTVE